MSTRFNPLPVLERFEHADFASAAREWDELLAASASSTPFLTSAWLGAWLQTLGSQADLEVVVARDPIGGELLGAAPFHVERHRLGGIACRTLRMLGSGPVGPDHLDLVVRTGHEHRISRLLWSAVNDRRRWDLLDLDGVKGTGLLPSLALRRRGDSGEAIPTPFLALASGWDGVSAGFGDGIVKNLGRYERKLEREAGAPVVERMIATKADLDPTLDDLFRLHQSVRREAGDVGSFANPEVRAFHRLAATRLFDAGRLRLHRLDVGDVAAAVIYCFRYGDTVSFYATGYDRRWKRYGPGRRIMAVAIRSAIEEGATEFDFLRGDEPYKRSWGTAMRTNLRIRRPSSPKGRLLWIGRAGRRAMRRLVDH